MDKQAYIFKYRHEFIVVMDNRELVVSEHNLKSNIRENLPSP